MTFAVKSLYPSVDTEAIVTALLIVVAVRSFEHVLKQLLTSGGKERVSTSQYALAAAVDQAWNPLNYVPWLRGRPDFKIETGPPKYSQGRRRIHLQRATIAIIIMLLSLIAEAAFFWGTQTKDVDLTNDLLQIAVNTTNANTGMQIVRRECKPIEVKEGRAHLKAVFSVCNIQKGIVPTQNPENINATIQRKQYAIGVATRQGLQDVESWATFTLLMQKQQNLVVRLNGKLQEETKKEVLAYYRGQGCVVSEPADVTNLKLSNCKNRVDPFEPLKIIVDFMKVWQDGPAGDVGTINGDNILVSAGDVNVGVISRQNFTAVAVLAITATLFVLSFVCTAFVADDTAEVVACMLRERTGQDPTTPTVAMGEGEVRIKRSFNDETQEWYIGTVVPDGYEEKTEGQ